MYILREPRGESEKFSPLAGGPRNSRDAPRETPTGAPSTPSP